MIVQDVIDFLHSIAPNHLQEPYDNSGLLVGDRRAEVGAVLVSLDVTEEVIDEAIEKNCNLIVSHHPIIFSGVKRIIGENHIQRIIKKAIKKDINLFAIHTNLDNVLDSGVNHNIADIIGLSNCSILSPKDPQVPKIGSGIIGDIEPLSELSFLKALKEKMELTTIKHTSFRNQDIAKVAICGGSGRFLLETAIAAGANIFISSDFKYHEYFEADGKILIADIGHYESERFTNDMIVKLLTKNFANFAAHCTKVNTNPVQYF